MDYGMVSKIEKARRYVDEREQRIQFESFAVVIRGENGTHRLMFENNKWQCDCEYFKTRGVCSHRIALERILQGMVPGPGESE
ncbi:MAG: hypothetical protein M5R40_01375 [Anaerolineae bacterium]|nr:hypothetical protein [Anaerolineae bacterium]